MITLAEAKGAGGSFVHKVPNQKKNMTQMTLATFKTRILN